uniref:ATP synthase subunit f, mitochondrial n=1 Tax=Neogobius melanostomus TaxID=47308 RepID=A0A8C6UKC0_9GOBI
MALTAEKSQLSPLKSGHFLSELWKAESQDCNLSQRAEVLKDGLRMDGHSMGMAALSSPARTFLEAEVSSEAFAKDAAALFKANLQEAKREMEEKTRDVRKQDERSARGALSQQRLGQVMLRELPDWLVSRSPRRPRDALQLLHRGWQWYYRRYIDVRKGGVGGVAMLLAGYCVLSYVWAFPQLKRERWRKYH